LAGRDDRWRGDRRWSRRERECEKDRSNRAAGVLKDHDSPKAQRAMEAMLRMQKIERVTA
jgi:hypothetical protein